VYAPYIVVSIDIFVLFQIYFCFYDDGGCLALSSINWLKSLKHA